MRRVPLVIAVSLAACARTPPPEPQPVVLRTELCRSTLTLTGDGGAQDARIGSMHQHAAVRYEYTAFGALPQQVTAEWPAEVVRYPDGREARRTDNHYAGATLHYVGRLSGGRGSTSAVLRFTCGADRAEAIALPYERRVRVTTDPEGASLFDTQRAFMGTTPFDLVVETVPDRGVRIRHGTRTADPFVIIEKSGFHAVRARVVRIDVPLRVVLQPLPRR